MMRTLLLSAILACVMPFALMALESQSLFKKQEAEKSFRPVLISQWESGDERNAFIEMARTGVREANARLGIECNEIRIETGEDVASTLKSLASAGYSPIITVGHQYVPPVLAVAEPFPNTKFVVIDGLVPPRLENIQSVTFSDHEGAFLVGMIAGAGSKTGKIGFIGGMDVPHIRNFGYGYTQGAEYTNPDIEVIVDMVGSDMSAWESPGVAAKLARRQIEESDVDVVFAAAGASSLGALGETARHKRYAIGVDTNQNGLYPGYVLTSMVKRVDMAVYNVLKTTHAGDWHSGLRSVGLAEHAFDFAVDNHNKELLSAELVEKVLHAKELIINGGLTVERYRETTD